VTFTAIVAVWTRPPEIPVMVIVAGPTVAVFAAEIVKILVPVVFAALNHALTPAGIPLAFRATIPLKPPMLTTEIVPVDSMPSGALMFGVADNEKFGASTVSGMLVVCVKLPEVPVIVMVDDPAAAVLATVSVRMLEVVVLEGLNDAVTPAGRPLAERLTDPLKLLISITVIVLAPLLPWATLTGEADNE